MEINSILLKHAIVLYDGECGMCSSSVKFIIKNDPKAYFKFLPISHPKAQELLTKNYGSQLPDSVVLINQSGVFVRSQAVFRIAQHLKYPWRVASLLRIIPTVLCDLFYNLIAKMRRKLFKKPTMCLMANEQLKERFLD